MIDRDANLLPHPYRIGLEWMYPLFILGEMQDESGSPLFYMRAMIQVSAYYETWGLSGATSLSTNHGSGAITARESIYLVRGIRLMKRSFGCKILACSIVLGISLHAEAAPVPRTEGLKVKCENTDYISRVKVTNRVCFDDEESCSYAAAYMYGIRFGPDTGIGGEWGNAVPDSSQVECRSCAFTHNGQSTSCDLKLIVSNDRGGVREFSNQDVSWRLAGAPRCFPVKRYSNNCQGDNGRREYTDYCVSVVGELTSGGAYCRSNPLCGLKNSNPLPESFSIRSGTGDDSTEFAACATEE